MDMVCAYDVKGKLDGCYNKSIISNFLHRVRLPSELEKVALTGCHLFQFKHYFTEIL